MQPIAITGIGCRLPGDANDAESLWHLLEHRVDALRDVPPDRWNYQRFYHPEPGRERRTCQRQGGFIRHPELFDAGFFGISPREATAMDPQQRILLEVAWEALEDAGYPLERVSGSSMGVFTGISVHDYADLQDIDSLSTHSVSGWALCMASNRISYAFDFRGPSFSVDTACSSALVALHQACLAMDKGECDGALVCGSNSLLHPMHHIAFSRLSMLSPTSRCHAFDKSADGYVRSEGAGVVVLKPLERAVADGDRIYAVLHRTVVNSDGRNEGLTVPNVDAQIRLLQTAYRDLPIEKVRYVEAHGTGTQVGDPVEARAIGEVLRHPSRPMLVGSVKTNIGHLEAGAGIAGLIKACLVAWKRTVPPNLHFHEPNPKIPFDDLGLVIPTESYSLPEDTLLGVNSFGFGGTNGHAVLGTHPHLVGTRTSDGPHVICLSAKSEGAVNARRESLKGLPASTIAYTALARRTHMPYRMAYLSDDAAPPPPQLVRHRPRIAFVYSGQGSQWVGMGRSLLSDAHFSAFIEACEPHFLQAAGWSLKAALHDDALRLEETRLAQPLVFAVQAGLTTMLRAWGIEAEAVLGHSVGEVAAAWAAGHLSLSDAIHLVVNRGRIMDGDTSKGRMLAVSAAPDAVTPYLSDGVGVAAINAPASVTLSGTAAGIDKVRQRLRDSGFDCTDVRVEYAFHSAQLDGLQGDLFAALKTLQPQTPESAMISTVTGLPASCTDAAYWWQNVRQAVRFADAVQTARDMGLDTFIEIGGHPVLGPALVENGVRTIPTLRRQQPERRAFLATLAELYRLGAPVQWGEPDHPQWTRWPRYPWQHERFWQESQRCAALRLDQSNHALLGQPGGNNAWTLSVSPDDPSWMGHHHLNHQVVLSASTVVEMGLEAAHATGRSMPLLLEKVHIDAACYINPGTVLNVLSDGLTFSILHDGKPIAGGTITTGTEVQRTLDIEALQATFERVNEGSLKAEFDARGLQFGPTFDTMQRVWSHHGEALAEIVGEARLPAGDGFSFTHPGTVDSCFQALLATTDQTMSPPGTTFMPIGMERVRLLHPLEGRVFVHVRLRHQTHKEVLVDLAMHAPDGWLLMEVQGYRLVRALERAGSHPLDALGYSMQWESCDIGEREERTGGWLVFSDGSALSDRLVERLDDVHVVKPGERFDLRDVQPLAGCIHLQALSATRQDPATPLLPLIDLLVQAEEHDLPVPRLWAVSRRAQPVAGEVNPDGAPLWGFVRVLATEEPYLNPTLIDMDADDVDAIVAELSAKVGEEVAYRNGQRLVHRCHRLPLSTLPIASAPSEGGFALICDPPGTLEGLRWRSHADGPLAPGEVRVEVAAVGLNFSDVMRALGLYPTEGLLGVELSGRVLEVGQDVSDIVPGDRVMGLGAGTFASTVDIPRHFLVRTPEALSDTEAAALPLAFATSYFALLETARLQKGERILIHAATGGVGQAAMQVARNVGAEIYATAGSEEKRRMLTEQGVVAVFDSRTTEFADQVQVDVVLNSLSGDGLVRGLDTLRRFGRFVDLTKRDIYADMPVGLNPFRRGLSYTAVDLEQVMHHAPQTIQKLLLKLQDDVVAGRVKPLPTQTWPYDRAEEAFRTMSQARHVGKVVLVRSIPERIERSARSLTPGRWLVTGGLGGFGSEVVRWLVAHGAEHVAVMTRTAREHPDPRVSVHAGDVSDAASVAAVCKAAGPLQGIVHAAMQLDDVPTRKLTRERLEKVFQAKIHGAWNLHQATLDQPLDAFILFSSNATWFGSGGQGNYSAANAYLDGLAHARRSQGRPALVVNWGPIGDVGYLARNPQVASMLASGGSRLLASGQALEALERLLLSDVTQAGIMDVDWDKMGQGPTRRSARFAPLLSQADEPAPVSDDVRKLLLVQLARVLGTSPEAIDPRRPVSEMGLDSLMSLQLRNWAKTTFNVTVTASALLAGPTVEELVGMLTVAPTVAVEVASDPLEHLDDDAVDELLAALLLEDGSVP